MSTQTMAAPAMTFTPPKRNSLTHIPGDEGWPIIGKTLDVLADPKGHIERSAAKYGLVYRSHLFGETSLVLLGPEANEPAGATWVSFTTTPVRVVAPVLVTVKV